jgi:hypothetical protein
MVTYAGFLHCNVIVDQDDGPRAMGAITLVVAEETWHVPIEGSQLERRVESRSLNFIADADLLRDLAAKLVVAANDAEAFAAQMPKPAEQAEGGGKP